MKFALPVVAAALAAATDAASLSGCNIPSTQQLRQNDSCASLGHAKQLKPSSLAVEGLVGEKESVQVMLELPAGGAEHFAGFSYSVDGAVKTTLEVFQVGFVNCLYTSRYGDSGGGWISDPLLPLFAEGSTSASGTFAGTTTSTPASDTRAPFVVWVTYTVPAQAESFTVTFTAGAYTHSVPVTVTPWTHLSAMPSKVQMQRDFKQIWAFTNGPLETIYHFPNDTVKAKVEGEYDNFMADHYFPADSLYKTAPYADFDYYKYLVSSGAYLLNVANIGRCSPTYTDAIVDKILDGVEPTIQKILAQGWDVKPYIYGFDEQGQSCEGNIRLLFGKAKARWGDKVWTMAALNPPVNWKNFSTDMPVDVLVHQYQFDMGETFKKEWAALGKEIYFYHCIEPHQADYLNTFIERPRTQGRALFWYGAARGAGGWLYYATDIWTPYPGTKHHPIQRGTGGSSLTDFPPANYIWAPRTDIFANGDGQFLYPGPNGQPVAASRLSLERDAMEDYVLLSLALASPHKAAALALIAKVVSSPTVHNNNALLMESVRSDIAKLLQ